MCLVVSSIKLSQLQTVEIATKIVYKGHFDEIENDVTLKMEYYSTQYLLGVSNKHKSILIVISVKLCGPIFVRTKSNCVTDLIRMVHVYDVNIK